MKKWVLFLSTLTIFGFIYFLNYSNILNKETSVSAPVKEKRKPISPSDIPSEGSEKYQCITDEDCILVSVGECCSFVAVNKNFKDEIKSSPKICTAICYVKAACNKGICEKRMIE